MSDMEVPSPRKLRGRKRRIIERRRSCRRRNMIVSSATTDSSADESNHIEPDNLKKGDRKRAKSWNSKVDYLLRTSDGNQKLHRDEIQPIAVDQSITFKSIGGLEPQINKLKEMVIFPLLYKEFFTARGVIPPRGILFHGLPGTGKTLLARALASEASTVGGRQVSFFLRKGADILNKWIGESERHLKLLFEQAVLKQPSIIFFDEIDGLAPIRSSKTEQVHNSIVSTLLAELDGLQDRGDVIVIGATNRIESVDPAVRRPGRFDLEFQFLLPSYQGRRDIFEINLKHWTPPLEPELLEDLALMTVGYSGADIKLLCAEACISALRRRYPQIYQTNQKLVLDYNSIKVGRNDWEGAINVVGRSTERSVFNSTFTGLPLPRFLEPLLSHAVQEMQKEIREIFPQQTKKIFNPYNKLLMIDMGPNHDVLEHVVSATLNSGMDGIPIYLLSIQTLAIKNTSTDEAGIAQFFTDVKRTKAPAVIFIPYVDHLYESLSLPSRLIFEKEIVSLFYHPVLVIAFCKSQKLPKNFAVYFKCIELSPTPMTGRCDFFRSIFTHTLYIKLPPKVTTNEELPIAPPLPIIPTPEKLPISDKQEGRILRELRVFLREITFKLLRNKKFNDFVKPVDPEEVPDYYEVIAQPMCLDTMLLKVGEGLYHSAAEFMSDIHLITQNALDYNPTRSEADRDLRHHAIDLRDVATLLIDNEMDSDFEDLCQQIIKKHEESRGMKSAKVMGSGSSIEVPSSSYTREGNKKGNLREMPTSTSPNVRKLGNSRSRGNGWAKGKDKKAETSPTSRRNSESSCCASSSAQNGVSTTTYFAPEVASRRSSKRHVKEEEQTKIESSEISPPQQQPAEESQMDEDSYVLCSEGSLKNHRRQVKQLYKNSVEFTMCYTIRELLEVRFKLLSVIEDYEVKEKKTKLLEKLKVIVEACQFPEEGS